MKLREVFIGSAGIAFSGIFGTFFMVYFGDFFPGEIMTGIGFAVGSALGFLLFGRFIPRRDSYSARIDISKDAVDYLFVVTLLICAVVVLITTPWQNDWSYKAIVADQEMRLQDIVENPLKYDHLDDPKAHFSSDYRWFYFFQYTVYMTMIFSLIAGWFFRPYVSDNAQFFQKARLMLSCYIPLRLLSVIFGWVAI